MSDVRLWNPAAASNTSSPPNGAPERGLVIGQISDTFREIMAAVRRLDLSISGVKEATDEGSYLSVVFENDYGSGLLDGDHVRFRVPATIPTPQYLYVSINGFSIIPVYSYNGSQIESTDLQPGYYLELIYKESENRFYLASPLVPPEIVETLPSTLLDGYLADDTATEGPVLELWRHSESPRTDDLGAVLNFYMNSLEAAKQKVAAIGVKLGSPLQDSLASSLRFSTMTSGVYSEKLVIGDGVYIGSTDPGAGIVSALNGFYFNTAPLPYQRRVVLPDVDISGIASDQTLVVAHGLPITPVHDQISWVLRCVTAEHGWIEGDKVQPLQRVNETGSNFVGFYLKSISPSKLTIVASRASATAPFIPVASGTSTFASITPAKWVLEITILY